MGIQTSWNARTGRVFVPTAGMLIEGSRHRRRPRRERTSRTRYGRYFFVYFFFSPLLLYRLLITDRNGEIRRGSLARFLPAVYVTTFISRSSLFLYACIIYVVPARRAALHSERIPRSPFFNCCADLDNRPRHSDESRAKAKMYKINGRLTLDTIN